MKANFLATNTIIMTHKPLINPTTVPIIHETSPLEDPDPERRSTFVCNSCVVLNPFESVLVIDIQVKDHYVVLTTSPVIELLEQPLNETSPAVTLSTKAVNYVIDVNLWQG